MNLFENEVCFSYFDKGITINIATTAVNRVSSVKLTPLSDIDHKRVGDRNN